MIDASPPRPDGPDREASGPRVYLAPGRLFASAEPAQVTTIVGSCVTVCLWDAASRVGGLNHFLLPEGGAAPSPRFGDGALVLLLRDVLALGARRSRLRARIFGGASIFGATRPDPSALGPRNVEAARKGLRTEGIPVIGEDVGGHLGRKVVFEVHTGSARVQAIPGGA